MPEMDFSKLKKQPTIKLISYTSRKNFSDYGPDEISAFGALGCFEEKTPSQLYDDLWLTMPKEKLDEKADKIINASIGRGHGAVADQNAFVFEIENLSRAATLFLCSPNYLSHLQQSLRRANADRGYELPETILTSGINRQTVMVLDNAFKLYEEMIKAGIPNEDARYVLPLYTRTNIQTLGNARELTHLHAMAQSSAVPTLVKNVVEDMIKKASEIAPKLFKKRKMNYEKLAWYPAPQIFSEKNETMRRIINENRYPDKVMLISHKLSEETIMSAIIDRDESELANMKHVHNGSQIEGFLAPISLVTLHQAIRQRTWDQSVQSIYDAAERAEFVTPKKIEDSEWKNKYILQCKDMLALYKMLNDYNVGKNDSIGVIPHSTIIYDLIHINGWNALHSIGKRTCTEAQWEVREMAEGIALEIAKTNPKLFSYMGPQCKIYGICPEKKPCNRFGRSLK